MRLEEIIVDSFRNYDKISLLFTNNPIILLGNNAQGKTNLLESIYYLATGTAYRPNRDRELINWQKDYFTINAKVRTINDRQLMIGINYENSKKTIKINGVKKNTLQELLGNLNVVLFAPEDLKLIKGNPEERRVFINREISQISNQYFYFLSQYKKILNQRNTALKVWKYGGKKDFLNLLNIWDNQLVYYGSRVVKKRIDFIEQLSDYAKKKHLLLTNNQEKLEIIYNTNSCNLGKAISLSKVTDEYEHRLSDSSKEELERGLTLIGPQRDDLIFLINNREIKNFGSQGQQRSAVLSVKLALIEVFKEKTGTFPVLLLDDVMSELDHKRRSYLLELTGNDIQTFITTTSLYSFGEEILKNAQILSIENGEITPFNLKDI